MMAPDSLRGALAERFGAERLDDPEVTRTLDAALRHLALIAAIHIEPTDDGGPE